jgi:hypothetical protein
MIRTNENKKQGTAKPPKLFGKIKKRKKGD